MLAIEAQGRRIETIEGISTEDAMHPVQEQFVENDGQQCGFCTPGLVMAGKALADSNPRPSMAEVESGLSGNICRCGTYVGVRKAVYEAARA
ncbi:MAG: 2Fe-2S iron-sulfur cluster-binding protein [Bryobacterales bacterium]|nr:2Fe-2S iron-sulfur cluster-binding protein [Bryobacterales bacterium]